MKALLHQLKKKYSERQLHIMYTINSFCSFNKIIEIFPYVSSYYYVIM